MITGYLTFFIAFQVCCLLIATVTTVFNIIKLKDTPWFHIYIAYGITLAVMTFRHIQVFVICKQNTFTMDAVLWQTIIAMGFLITSSMAYALLHKK